jgi:DNA-binding NtrC family response regulator
MNEINETKILIAEDEDPQRNSIKKQLNLHSFRYIDEARDGIEAIEKIQNNSYDIIIADKNMPAPQGILSDQCGIEILKASKSHNPDTEVIIITAFSSVPTAFEAGGLRAADYLEKPVDFEEKLLPLILKINQEQICKKKARLLSAESNPYQIVGESKEIQKLRHNIEKAAESDAGVLITGETGTGKELVARNIHQQSERNQKPYEARNCGAFSDTMLEDELFGHAKGAFTGATNPRPGLFEYATNGTLFLDEIGDASLETQLKLLRVIETREFQRLGDNKTLKFAGRIIAATNKKLEAEIAKGTFRSDLYYRLKVIEVEVPPLRIRKEDIPLLSYYFLQKYKGDKHYITGFDPKVFKLFHEYAWPGNVRELERAIERAVVYCDKSINLILPMHLPKGISPSSGTELKHTKLVEEMNKNHSATPVDPRTKAFLLALHDIVQTKKEDITTVEIQEGMNKYLPDGFKVPESREIGSLMKMNGMEIYTYKRHKMSGRTYTILPETIIDLMANYGIL